MSQSVDPKSVQQFRTLRFETIDECLDEIGRILQADREGQLNANGNWSAGQCMSHVAAWIEYGYDGYPIARPPFFVRWIMRLLRGRMLAGKMPRGVRIPKVPEGTIGMDESPTHVAGDRLIRAFERLKRGETARYDSPAFGGMSHDDRIRLNLRHAELHLGYLSY